MRDGMRRLQMAAAVALALACGFGAARWRDSAEVRVKAAESAPPQTPTSTGKTVPQLQDDPLAAPGDAEKARLEAQHDRMWTDERRKKIVSDTDKLLQLATELKMDVDKSTRNELSIKVIQKAGEIEKLSHDVKERMKN
jgi:hypothetical protein